MMIEIIRSKIHRVRITAADLNYIGSITIDQDLLDAANMVLGEKVQVVNIQNGERFETYTIPGARGTGEVSVNGPAARKVQPGDIIIVMSYGLADFEEARNFKPTIIFPNEETNRLD